MSGPVSISENEGGVSVKTRAHGMAKEVPLTSSVTVQESYNCKPVNLESKIQHALDKTVSPITAVMDKSTFPRAIPQKSMQMIFANFSRHPEDVQYIFLIRVQSSWMEMNLID